MKHLRHLVSAAVLLAGAWSGVASAAPSCSNSSASLGGVNGQCLEIGGGLNGTLFGLPAAGEIFYPALDAQWPTGANPGSTESSWEVLANFDSDSDSSLYTGSMFNRTWSLGDSINGGTAFPTTSSGDWSLTGEPDGSDPVAYPADDPNLTFDIVILFRPITPDPLGGTGTYTDNVLAFLLSGLSFNTANSLRSGLFDLASGTQDAADVSGVTIIGRSVIADSNNGGGGGTGQIPEPGILALLGLAVASSSLVRRVRSA